MQISLIKWFQEKFCHLGEGLLAIRAPQPMQKFFSMWPPAAATRRCRLIEGNKVLRRLAKPLFRYLYLIATGKFALHPEWFQIAGLVIPKMNRKWSSTASDPEMISKGKSEWLGLRLLDHRVLFIKTEKFDFTNNYEKESNCKTTFKTLFNQWNAINANKKQH